MIPETKVFLLTTCLQQLIYYDYHRIQTWLFENNVILNLLQKYKKENFVLPMEINSTQTLYKHITLNNFGSDAITHPCTIIIDKMHVSRSTMKFLICTLIYV